MNPNFSSQSSPIKLYRYSKSGHSHRAQLILSLLDVPYDLIEVDLGEGEHKSADFLSLNPFGQVPTINDNGVFISDSNAILVYLAKKYAPSEHWLPKSAKESAEVQRWLSVAAGEIASGPAAARLFFVFGAKLDLKQAQSKSHKLLKLMNQILLKQPYLTGSQVTVADVACYSYIAHAPEGGVLLDDYISVLAWLDRIRSLPRFVPMDASEIQNAT